jgi:arginase
MNTSSGDGTACLIWRQWQGRGTSSVKEFASEFLFDVARRGHAMGTAVHEAVLLAQRPTATVPVAMSDVLTLKVCDVVIGKNIVRET